MQGIDYSCLDCSGEDSTWIIVVATAVFAVVLLAALLLLRHMGRVGDTESTQRPSGPRGFVERKLTSVKVMVMKVLPLTAIKIVVVVWQIVFQV